MNPKILIILFSSLLTFTFIVDADQLKTCTKTKTYSETTTLTKSCGTLIPGQTIPAEVCPSVKNNKEQDCKGFIKTTTVTCIPTTMETIACPPIIPIEECCKEGGKGLNNLRFIGGGTIGGFCPYTVTNAVDCCKCCYEEGCDAWSFSQDYCNIIYAGFQYCSGTFDPQYQDVSDGIIGCHKCRGTIGE